MSRDEAAHAVMAYSWQTEAMQDMESPIEAYELVDLVTERSLSWPKMVCPTCQGGGTYYNPAPPGIGEPMPCESCGGRGWVIDPKAIEALAVELCQNAPAPNDEGACEFHRKRAEAGLLKVMEAGE